MASSWINSDICGVILLPSLTTLLIDIFPEADLVNAKAVDEDREAFFILFNKLLWDDDEDGSRGMFRRQGLLRQTMPMMFRQQNTVTGGMYRNLADRCYGWLCALGLKGMANRLLQLTL